MEQWLTLLEPDLIAPVPTNTHAAIMPPIEAEITHEEGGVHLLQFHDLLAMHWPHLTLHYTTSLASSIFMIILLFCIILCCSPCIFKCLYRNRRFIRQEDRNDIEMDNWTIGSASRIPRSRPPSTIGSSRISTYSAHSKNGKTKEPKQAQTKENSRPIKLSPFP